MRNERVKKCIRCKDLFEMPKGRTVCYLCAECRRWVVEEDRQFETLDTVDRQDYSEWDYNAG